MAAKLSADLVLQLAKNRRTYYALSKDLPVSAQRIQEIVKESTLHTPSAFNSQTNRLVVLFGAEHDKLWDITSDSLKAIVPAEAWENTANRIAGFKGAAGTILFFTDVTQTNAIQQYILWTALEAEGLGANLQHYNPLIDEKVAETWKLPATWQLNAQLVFGAKTGEAGEKEYTPVEERVKVFGA
ncbi:hypothetical protein CEP54_008428 [Fusarium duplospermum]|uniref:Nitroreductase domain-containing protein n=1 Tax=Fusarium duplospermum TaxID=1325734 RepID=A0A428PVS4_9HYPO|nr:hypothetical protein CEP54_008428 [Fusarium duplospermum]